MTLHSLLVGIQDGTVILEDSLTVSYNADAISLYDSAIMLVSDDLKIILLS